MHGEIKKEEKAPKYRKIVTFCKLFEEIAFKVHENFFFEEIGLREDSWHCVEESEKIARLVSRLETLCNSPEKCVLSFGGSGMNTISLVSEKKKGRVPTCFFYTKTGRDSLSSFARKFLTEKGVVAIAPAVEGASLPKVCVILRNGERTMITEMAGAPAIGNDVVDKMVQTVDCNTILYVVGYSLEGVEREGVKKLLRTKREKNAFLVLNLSSERVVKEAHEKLEILFRGADFLVGNKKEFLQFHAMRGGPLSEKNLLLFLKNLGIGFAMTNGEKHVLGSFAGGDAVAIKPPRINGEINTCGAGDAFAAGILSSLCKPTSIENALREGISFSHEFIKRKERIPTLFVDWECKQ